MTDKSDMTVKVEMLVDLQTDGGRLSCKQQYERPAAEALSWALLEWARLVDGARKLTKVETMQGARLALQHLDRERRDRGAESKDFQRIPRVARILQAIETALSAK
jgi:hypothetical protein